jgi:hypothetical protein
MRNDRRFSGAVSRVLPDIGPDGVRHRSVGPVDGNSVDGFSTLGTDVGSKGLGEVGGLARLDGGVSAHTDLVLFVNPDLVTSKLENGTFPNHAVGANQSREPTDAIELFLHRMSISAKGARPPGSIWRSGTLRWSFERSLRHKSRVVVVMGTVCERTRKGFMSCRANIRRTMAGSTTVEQSARMPSRDSS